jgi:hypothetical protein
MLTSHECRARAEEKLAQADHDGRNRKRLISAAEGWLFLASQMRRLEVVLADEEGAPKRCPKARVKTNAPKSTRR